MTPQGHRDIDVVGNHHAALTTSQCRGLRKIEHRSVAKRSNQLALISRSDRLGGILDQHEIVFLCHCPQAGPVRRVAVGVAGDDRARVRCDAGFNLIRGQCSGPVIDIGEYRSCAGDADGVGRLPERMGGRDHFLPRAYSIGPERQQQPKRSARNGNRIFATDIGRKGRLESLHRRAGGKPGRAHDSIDGLDFGQGDIRVRKRDEAVVRFGDHDTVVITIGILHDGEFGHDITFLSASTIPLARIGSAVICRQWSLRSTR